MLNYFKQKTIVITGATSGIGAALVSHLALIDCTIIVIARNEGKIANILNNYGNKKAQLDSVVLDFSKKNDYQKVANEILQKHQKVDILINNAGIAQKSLVHETTEQVERQLLEVNYFSNILLTKAFLPHFIERKAGHIIGISSILGEIGLPLVGPYCASKHAVNGYYNSMRYDLEKFGIDVSTISPGFIRTEITKKSLKGDGEVHAKDSLAQEKGMDASVCAKKILQKIAKRKRMAYVGGIEILMPKFARLFPRLFHYLMKKMHKI